MNDKVQSLIKYASKSPYWRRPEVLDKYLKEIATAVHHNEIDISWKVIEPLLFKRIETGGWVSGVQGLPDGLDDKLLENAESFDVSMWKALNNNGISSLHGLPYEIKDRFLSKGERIMPILMKDIASNGYNPPNYPEGVADRILQQEPKALDEALLKGVESRGWGEATAYLPDDNKTRLLENPDLYTSLLGAINHEGLLNSSTFPEKI